jgi:DNA repair exonuclease SbcCD ATPase subunit
MLPALLLLGTLIALGLMLALLARQQKRHADLQAQVARLEVVQRDMGRDVRARLEDGARTWASIETDVQPRLDQIEPSLADLSAALEENLPALREARRRLEAVEARAEETHTRVAAALETAGEESAARFARLEEAVRTLRDAADERLADLAARLGALEQGPPAREPPPPPPQPHAEEEETEAPAEEESADASVVEAARRSYREATTGRGRGRRGDRKAGGSAWLVFALVLVAGLALLFSALIH